ncbi:glucosaminidase domain-containing protein [Synoicihabitans lomoniglobus]|uniref:Glucosaminidase domain-containing protein n=1 Tax=Synoicihabitans lomoniglobus TaxID=2909285 RepID=A0AAF0CN40_9BACT|nr:glucosaminidase domain-containing protein [Opitutaceae bacterium LMO-M01]WED64998.1 glucosaminidase domain-containing protein [Opitutaceae bacterium LMO-M01]
MSRPRALPTAARPRQRSVVTIAKVAGVVVVLFFVGRWIFGPEHLPDFGSIEDTSEKKAAFFTYLLPHITAVNEEILQQRATLQAIRDDLAEDDDEPGWLNRRRLDELCVAYDLEPPETYNLAFVDRLLRRVDIIAPSLVMAQAAIESAWGTSRFARQGNNLFGMRTYEPGTGIVPKRRPAGATWEVAAYDSVRGAIDNLAHNLNTNGSYRQMRSIRRDLRRRGAPITGSALAGGLVRYSEKGHEYISMVRSMIRVNDLERFDRPAPD